MTASIALVVGVIVGILISILATVLTMRSKMVVPERSSKSFQATCEAVEEVVPAAEGWSFPMESFDMATKLKAKGGLPDNVQRIRLYFLCNPKVAKVVLGAEPKLSAIMPCSWSVYELADGSVWVSHMNISMMSKMMGGVVGSSMGEVAQADERFLEQVLH
ncbi:MAG: DUF302 domain-containing protein [Acidobacteria bacterium]|jgi:uncharacterized protein (DUF302 family)|nr:DUF302 domain-containing protein [Acidobacteriota bacterium]